MRRAGGRMRPPVLAVLCLLTLPALGALASPAAEPSAFDVVRARLGAVASDAPLAARAAQGSRALDRAESFHAALGLPEEGRGAALLALAGGDASAVGPVRFERASDA